MDPNEMLDKIRELSMRINSGDTAEEGTYVNDADTLAELIMDLDTWISQGGFLPLAWENLGGRKVVDTSNWKV